jgi:tRNA threonylcarbamoyladenosine modification (KEOPS) complex  Pcc1 subunit
MDERKFVVKLKAKENELKLEVQANDVSSLLAGINSYMRLIKSSMGVLND